MKLLDCFEGLKSQEASLIWTITNDYLVVPKESFFDFAHDTRDSILNTSRITYYPVENYHPLSDERASKFLIILQDDKGEKICFPLFSGAALYYTKSDLRTDKNIVRSIGYLTDKDVQFITIKFLDWGDDIFLIYHEENELQYPIALSNRSDIANMLLKWGVHLLDDTMPPYWKLPLSDVFVLLRTIYPNFIG